MAEPGHVVGVPAVHAGLGRKSGDDRRRTFGYPARAPATPEPDLRGKVGDERDPLSVQEAGEHGIEALVVDQHGQVRTFVDDDLAQFGVGTPVVVIDEFLVRRNLPKATELILEQIA